MHGALGLGPARAMVARSRRFGSRLALALAPVTVLTFVLPAVVPAAGAWANDRLTTTVSPTAIVYGQSVTDVAHLNAPPPGDVSFYLCGPAASQCTASQGTLVGVQPLVANGGGSAAQVTLTPTAVGSYCFFAVLKVTDGLLPESPDGSNECFRVTPAPLTITASSGSTPAGGPVPTITPTITGLVNGESAATALTTPPTCATTATSASPAGTYPSTCTGAVAPNYSISSVPGTVTVTGATSPASSAPPTSPALSAATGLSPSAPTSKPILGATSVHTGEPWAGAQPGELGAGGLGAFLVTFGLRRRRRYALAGQPRP